MKEIFTHSYKTHHSPENRFDRNYLKSWMEPLAKEPISRFEFFTLKGDASDRSYFRVHYFLESRPKEKNSIIVMQLAQPDTEKEPDFNRMQKFLMNLKVPVPQILHYDAERGLLFLEDAGNTHLEDLARETPQRILLWYKKSIDLIITMQTHVTKNMHQYCPAYFLEFDVEKLMWEMDFMIKHYIKGLLKTKVSANDETKLQVALLDLCKVLAEQERVFTHRDFHSRNLMVQNKELLLIDFQDARMGPRQYDLVSLLKDSYVVLEDQTRDELLEYYLQRMEREKGQSISRSTFIKIFDWMSVQRNLKAIGSFAYLFMKKNNDQYIQYINPTLNYIRKTINSRPDLERLGLALNQLVPNLNAKTHSRTDQS